jgi:hypothetical protein
MCVRLWVGYHLPVIDEKFTKYGKIPCMRKSHGRICGPAAYGQKVESSTYQI